MTKNGNGCYAVVRFWPAGNLKGQFVQNVIISKGSKLNNNVHVCLFILFILIIF